MTKNEKKLLRVAVAIIMNVIIKDNKNGARYINQRIRKHPEKYDVEFITETGFPKQEVQRLLKVRAERLSAAQRSGDIQDLENPLGVRPE